MQRLVAAIIIAVFFLIENVFSEVIAIGGVAPDMMLAFVCVYGFLKRGMSRVGVVSLVVAMLSASGTGRVFPIAFVFCAMAGLVGYCAFSVMRFIPEVIRICVVIMGFCVISSTLELLVIYHGITASVIYGILLRGVYTMAVGAITYLIFAKTPLKDEDKGILLISERDFGDGRE